LHPPLISIALHNVTAEVTGPTGLVTSGRAGYADFVRESPAAGRAYYIVYLKGKMVRYFGRNGGEHIQYFSGAGAR
jgi:hypothetical protein